MIPVLLWRCNQGLVLDCSTTSDDTEDSGTWFNESVLILMGFAKQLVI